MLKLEDFSLEQRKHYDTKIAAHKKAQEQLKPLIKTIIKELMDRSFEIDGIEYRWDNSPGIKIITDWRDGSIKHKYISIRHNRIELYSTWFMSATMAIDLACLDINNGLSETGEELDIYSNSQWAKEIVDMMDRRRGLLPKSKEYAPDLIESAMKIMDDNAVMFEKEVAEQLALNFSFAAKLADEMHEYFGKQFYVNYGDSIYLNCFSDNRYSKNILWELALLKNDRLGYDIYSTLEIPFIQSAQLQVYYPEQLDLDNDMDYDIFSSLISLRVDERAKNDLEKKHAIEMAFENAMRAVRPLFQSSILEGKDGK